MTRHGLDIFLRQAILAEYEPYGTGLSGITVHMELRIFGLTCHWYYTEFLKSSVIGNSSVSMEEKDGKPINGELLDEIHLESHLTSIKCSSTLLNIARQIVFSKKQVKYIHWSSITVGFKSFLQSYFIEIWL